MHVRERIAPQRWSLEFERLLPGPRLLAFAGLFMLAACNDATSPPTVGGDEIRTPQHSLMIPSTIPQVSAGRGHACALKSDGTVVCWGGNNFSAPSIVPAGLTSVAQVSAGGYHTCVLKADGTVVCWGGDLPGAYGPAAATVPVGLSSVVQVSSGTFHTCALKTDQTIVCWGVLDPPVNLGQSIAPNEYAPFTQASAGGSHTCALETNETVVCWGGNAFGQATVPAGLTAVVQVSAGYMHTCARKTDGTVVCWGDNTYGQAAVPAGLGSVAQVSAGSGHTCARKADGSVVCWGSDDFAIPGPPPGLTAVQISSSYPYDCALKPDGTVLCWGVNENGQLDVPAGLNLNPAPPVANAGGPYTGYEGTAVTFDGTGSSDSGGQVLTYAWDFGDGSAAGTGVTPSHTYIDNGIYTVTVTVSNGTTSSTAAIATATIANVRPAVGNVAAATSPVQSGSNVTASAAFTDPGFIDTHTAVIDWGDGTSSAGTVIETDGSGSVGGAHLYTAAGVYTITMTVTDQDAGTAQSVFEFVVVFDPAGGFVTGGGWVYSPAGAFAADLALAGKATFGFVSRYHKGATLPTGNTQFQLHTGSLRFNSTSYDWLVVAGPQAKYKGSGTINGAGDFAFMLSAVDGAVSGGGGVDKFRIKIWNKDTGAIVYDNQVGAADDASPTASIAGGAIVIHK